jgi:hypothetical protein
VLRCFNGLGSTVTTGRRNAAVYVIRTARGEIRTLFFSPNDALGLDLDECESVLERYKIEEPSGVAVFNAISLFLMNFGLRNGLHLLLEEVFNLGIRYERDRRESHADRAGLSSLPTGQDSA